MNIDTIWFLIIVIVTLIGFSAAILLYLEKSKDKRISNVRKSSSLDKEDEAYNKVKSTKSITNVMKRSGKDTSDADVFIERAEMALQAGDHSKSISLAEEAKSKLEQATAVNENVKNDNKQDDMNIIKNEDGDSKMKEAYTIEDLDSLEKKKEDDELKAKSQELMKQKEKIQNLPENYLESKFEIEQATDMLEKEGGDEEAKKLLGQAKMNFENERYTEALKLSLRCKKTIDEDKAGLIKFQKIGEKEASDKQKSRSEKEIKSNTIIRKIDEEDEAGEEKIKTTPSEGKVKCPDCGYLGEMGDNFCPKCGTEMVIELRCYSCGKEVGPEDNFCPSCGHELSPSIYECPDCGAEVDEDVKFCPKCGIEFL